MRVDLAPWAGIISYALARQHLADQVVTPRFGGPPRRCLKRLIGQLEVNVRALLQERVDDMVDEYLALFESSLLENSGVGRVHGLQQ